MDVGVAVAETFGSLWVVGWRQEEEEELAGFLRAELTSNAYARGPSDKSSELRRSSNLGRRVVRIKSSKLSSHQMPVGTGRELFDIT